MLILVTLSERVEFFTSTSYTTTVMTKHEQHVATLAGLLTKQQSHMKMLIAAVIVLDPTVKQGLASHKPKARQQGKGTSRPPGFVLGPPVILQRLENMPIGFSMDRDRCLSWIGSEHWASWMKSSM